MTGSNSSNYRFEIALSFAGDDKRDIVREVAAILRARLGQGSVFFDEWFEAELAGPDAQIVLQNIYRKETRLVVACVCRRYNEKPWTQEEWRAIQAFERGLRDGGSDNAARLRFLPVRFGDGDVDGLFDTALVPDVRERSPDEIADLILKRLQIAKDRSPLMAAQPLPETIASPDITAAISESLTRVLFADGLKPRYILYIARERIRSLYLQVASDLLEASDSDLSRLLPYREPGAMATDEEDRLRAVRQLFTVLGQLAVSARIGDLASIVRERGRLDCDWYQVRSAFDAEPWNPHSSVVGLSTVIGDYKLILRCSKHNLVGVSKEGPLYIPTSVSYALLDGGRSIQMSGLVTLGAIDMDTMTLIGGALYLVLEPLNKELGTE